MSFKFVVFLGRLARVNCMRMLFSIATNVVS